MKKLLSIALAFMALATYAQEGITKSHQADRSVRLPPSDSVKMTIDGTNAYYQQVIKADTGIAVSAIYIRALQFMAAKNFQQNYGYEEEGKLIFTSTQDLNTNVFSTGNSENVDVFTVQFAITIDMKKQRYRYTIHNVLFFRPTETGNQRLTLYEMYLRETNGESRYIKKDAKKIIDAFEHYIGHLTAELKESINHTAVIYDTKF